MLVVWHDQTSCSLNMTDIKYQQEKQGQTVKRVILSYCVAHI